MGVSSIGGIQFIDRLFLILVPVKHHPSVSYVRRVCVLHIDRYNVRKQKWALIQGAYEKFSQIGLDIYAVYNDAV